MKMFGSVLDDLLKIKTATCHMSLGHCYLPHQSIAAGSMPPIATYPRPQKKKLALVAALHSRQRCLEYSNP